MRRYLLFALVLFAWPAAGQDFPNRQLRIVSGSAAGGSNDFVARFFADAIGTIFGQRIVVENRACVNGVIGAEAVVNSQRMATRLSSAR
jgi:tripartite-type tricarboxylate transporter receptor subunit TctC